MKLSSREQRGGEGRKRVENSQGKISKKGGAFRSRIRDVERRQPIQRIGKGEVPTRTHISGSVIYALGSISSLMGLILLMPLMLDRTEYSPRALLAAYPMHQSHGQLIHHGRARRLHRIESRPRSLFISIRLADCSSIRLTTTAAESYSRETPREPPRNPPARSSIGLAINSGILAENSRK